MEMIYLFYFIYLQNIMTLHHKILRLFHFSSGKERFRWEGTASIIRSWLISTNIGQVRWLCAPANENA